MLLHVEGKLGLVLTAYQKKRDSQTTRAIGLATAQNHDVDSECVSAIYVIVGLTVVVVNRADFNQ